MAKVPALVDGEIVVTETAAICAYLADKFIEKDLRLPLIHLSVQFIIVGSFYCWSY